MKSILEKVEEGREEALDLAEVRIFSSVFLNDHCCFHFTADHFPNICVS